MINPIYNYYIKLETNNTIKELNLLTPIVI